jgi:hypothetical protein
MNIRASDAIIVLQFGGGAKRVGKLDGRGSLYLYTRQVMIEIGYFSLS